MARPSRTVCNVLLCFVAVALLSACDEGKQATDLPVPTSMPTSVAKAAPVQEPTVNPGQEPTATPTPTPLPTSTPTPEPTPTPLPTSTPTPEPTPTPLPTSTPTPEPTTPPLPTSTPTPEPTTPPLPTSTPTPEPTTPPLPTSTPTPEPTTPPTPVPTPSPFLSVEWISSLPPTYPFQDIPHEFSINGNPNCVSHTDKALNLLKLEVPYHYGIANQYIGEIRCVESGSGMSAWSKPPVFLAGEKTVQAGTIWYAGTIIHDACHSKQFHDFLAMNSISSTPPEVYSGREAEAQCLAVQLDALRGIGAPSDTLDYVRDIIESEYWDIPYDERDW